MTIKNTDAQPEAPHSVFRSTGSDESNLQLPTKEERNQRDSTDSTSEHPTVVNVFDILGMEYQHLPYDPDEICKAVISKIDADDSEMRTIATVAESCSEITFPSQAIETAEMQIEDEYSQSEIIALLHLMQAHAKVILDPTHPAEAIPNATSDRARDNLSEQDDAKWESLESNHSIRVRSKKAIAHFGTKFKGYASGAKSRVLKLAR